MRSPEREDVQSREGDQNDSERESWQGDQKNVKNEG